MASYMMATGTIKVGNVLLGLGRCLRPNIVIPCRGFKKPFKSRLDHRRKTPGVGIYPGQISNFDFNNVNFFPATIPNIPFNEMEEYKPSKLLVIWKSKNIMKNVPDFQKRILEEKLNITDKTPQTTPSIVKNTPQMNKALWFVKHLITIRPLTFPNGIPTMDDLGATYIMPNGEMVINKKLQVPLELLEDRSLSEEKMDSETIKKLLRLWWIQAWDT